MSTHYLSSSTNQISLFKEINNNQFFLQAPDLVVSNNTSVTVIEQYIKTDCAYHKIQIDNNTSNYYVSTGSVYRLPNTGDFAPFKCSPSFGVTFGKNLDINSLQIGKPFLNKKNNRYNVAIQTPYISLNEFNPQEYANIAGTRAILDYFNIFYSDDDIKKYTSYYNFCTIEDYDIPFSYKRRIKLLASISKQNIDYLLPRQKQENLTTNDSAILVKTYDLQNILFYITYLFSKYQKDIYLSNVKINRLNLIKEANKIIKFFETLKSFFIINSISLTYTNEEQIELVIDECKKIKSISYKASKKSNCIYPKNGINLLLKDETFNNSRTLNFVEKLEEIYNIDFCTYPWSDFINNYLYPKQNINFNNKDSKKPTFEDIEANYNKLINLYNSYSLKTEKTYKELLVNSSTISDVQETFKSLKDPFITSGIPEEQLKKQYADQYTQASDSIETKAGAETAAAVADIAADPLTSIYDTLTKFGMICNLSPLAIKCLSKLIDLATLNYKFSLDIVKTYTYDELKTKIFNSLSLEEQNIFLNDLIDKSCISKKDLVAILKEVNEYTTDQLKQINNMSDKQLKNEIINILQGS